MEYDAKIVDEYRIMLTGSAIYLDSFIEVLKKISVKYKNDVSFINNIDPHMSYMTNIIYIKENNDSTIPTKYIAILDYKNFEAGEMNGI